MQVIKERPILFSGEMIRAVLEGRKTQTRRVCKIPVSIPRGYPGASRDRPAAWSKLLDLCPYGQPGDRLWVRETWCDGYSESHECWGFRADMRYQCGRPIPDDGLFKTWKPSIFMPRKYSRILLEVVDVRVERVNEISEEDAIAEGIYKLSSGYWSGGIHPIKETQKHLPSPIEGFQDLWDSINGKKMPWDSNPWVWVVTFKVLEKYNASNTK